MTLTVLMTLMLLLLMTLIALLLMTLVVLIMLVELFRHCTAMKFLVVPVMLRNTLIYGTFGNTQRSNDATATAIVTFSSLHSGKDSNDLNEGNAHCTCYECFVISNDEDPNDPTGAHGSYNTLYFRNSAVKRFLMIVAILVKT